MPERKWQPSTTVMVDCYNPQVEISGEWKSPVSSGSPEYATLKFGDKVTLFLSRETAATVIEQLSAIEWKEAAKCRTSTAL